jgi:hypothetical protein
VPATTKSHICVDTSAIPLISLQSGTLEPTTAHPSHPDPRSVLVRASNPARHFCNGGADGWSGLAMLNWDMCRICNLFLFVVCHFVLCTL